MGITTGARMAEPMPIARPPRIFPFHPFSKSAISLPSLAETIR
jgi:hypothetical protein